MNIAGIAQTKRRERNWSQDKLQAQSGLTQTQISRIESGKSDNVTIKNLRALTRAFDCAVSDLLPERDKTSRKGKAA